MSLARPELGVIFDFNPHIDVSKSTKTQLLEGLREKLDWVSAENRKPGEGIGLLSALACFAMVFPEDVKENVTDEQWAGLKKRIPPVGKVMPYITATLLSCMRLLDQEKFSIQIGKVTTTYEPYSLSELNATYQTALKLGKIERALNTAFAIKLLDPERFGSYIDTSKTEWDPVLNKLLGDAQEMSVIQSGLLIGQVKAIHGNIGPLFDKNRDLLKGMRHKLKLAWREARSDLLNRDNDNSWEGFVKAAAAMSLLSASIQSTEDGLKLNYPVMRYNSPTNPERRRF